ncbi:DUF3710 domain-containing protein [Asanoa siamensis]|uniref:DUF3710 domain-containing protein n=1 Tax=Asanoa siamensis TaxID=926357 RepID=A0ABQ4CUA4_9ACTN|nr:hypothetical protein Asi02nite_43840 [Asanoa siamensis]
MFSRGGSGRHARDDRGRSERPARGSAAVPQPDDRRHGPYDVSEAPSGVERLDLGSLQIPAVPEVEIRVQANPDGAVQQVVLVNGDNALQVGVFAAPRSEGIWDEVREEIRKSLFSEGVAAQESQGEYGVELRARVRTADGLTDLRFLGIDGPRWMVRGVFQGPAATDPGQAGVLVECLHGLVVDRGQEARPVREPLPLRLPKDATDQVHDEQEAAAAQPPLAPPTNGSGPGGAGPAPRRRPSPRPR